jgi:rhodanese-related sulfurtransferase
MQRVQQISTQDYNALRNEDDAPTLIDVREDWEFKFAHIEGARLKPLGEIQFWSQTLDKNAAYVVVCHHGGRSGMACEFLQQLGFKNVKNLDGGIDAWSITVDKTVPRY